ncbi:hypothetical protein ASPFODRAFT_54303 [Aspergillus luchuensis CBS 106.47]|uniref:Uncharacterized protein n=1 Tax=Aspergillus luchuensis (strain CBS 106.47) TaxID=1137211 RepID=A0A1M3SZJ7_ASPLC|nr:hypothetical protein ASPFODRAFT_54303 [Aspergillus luchuensis CBS 106.47]
MYPPRFRPGTYSVSSPEICMWNSYCTASSPPLLQRYAHVLSRNMCIPARTSSVVQANSCVRRDSTQSAVEL